MSSVSITAEGLRDFYSGHYPRHYRHDSPVESRKSMAKKVIGEVVHNRARNILDIGAGPGDVEGKIIGGIKSSLVTKGLLPALHLVSLDIATIPSHRLIAPKSRQHVRADSRQMPFSNETFDVVFSNLSIDMLRRFGADDYDKAMAETARVLKMGGSALLFFHPHELFRTLSDLNKDDADFAAGYFDGDDAHNPFYAHEDEICEDLERFGLDPLSIETRTSEHEGNTESWWEVKAKKTKK